MVPLLPLIVPSFRSTDMLIGTCEDIEQSGFSAILLAGKGEAQHSILRQRILVVSGMVFSALAKTRVGVVVVQVGIAASLFKRFAVGV